MNLSAELAREQRDRLPQGGYEKLQAARVAVAGLGGLGSHVAMELARSGVGCLHLIDFDTVDVSNLNRQLYQIQDIGCFKTDALARSIAAVHPDVRVVADRVQVTEENLPRLFAEETLVCEAFDRPENKAMLVNGLLAVFPEIRVVAASGMAGYGGSNAIRTRRLGRRLYVCGDLQTGLAPAQGLLGPRVSICAGHQANMILELILGKKE